MGAANAERPDECLGGLVDGYDESECVRCSASESEVLSWRDFCPAPCEVGVGDVRISLVGYYGDFHAGKGGNVGHRKSECDFGAVADDGRCDLVRADFGWCRCRVTLNINDKRVTDVVITRDSPGQGLS